MGKPTYEELERKVEALEAEVERLRKLIEEVQRAGKRQAAPFRKPKKGNAKKPGRKPGEEYGNKAHRAIPEKVDEVLEAELPKDCPHCQAQQAVVETSVEQQYQTEIPRTPIVRQINVHVGECRCCHKRVQGRHPLQTSDALGAAASQLGPDAQAAAAWLNKEAGLSHGKVCKVFDELFGIPLSRGGSAQVMQRVARRCEKPYEEIREMVRGSPIISPDETGWRVNGETAWLHAFASPQAVYYEIAPSRDHTTAARLLGLDWSGVMIHDGWSVYDHFEQAEHQQCLAHLSRRLTGLLETAVGGAVHFPRRIAELVDRAFALRRDYRSQLITSDDMAVGGLFLSVELEEAVSCPLQHAANERLRKHLSRHLREWFWFLYNPAIEATNWWSEQALRPAVVNRKVWGGNRTWLGAHAQSVLSSILTTCRLLSHSALNFLSSTLTSPTPILLTR